MSEQRPRPSREKLTEMVRNRNLKKLLEENPTFRQFVWTLLVQARIFAPTHSPGSPYDTAYLEGRRSLGLEVLNLLKHVRPDVLSILEKEGNLLDEDEAREAASQSQTDEDPNDQP